MYHDCKIIFELLALTSILPVESSGHVNVMPLNELLSGDDKETYCPLVPPCGITVIYPLAAVDAKIPPPIITPFAPAGIPPTPVHVSTVVLPLVTVGFVVS